MRFSGLLEVIFTLSARILEVKLFVTFRPQSLTASHNQLLSTSFVPTYRERERRQRPRGAAFGESGRGREKALGQGKVEIQPDCSRNTSLFK